MITQSKNMMWRFGSLKNKLVLLSLIIAPFSFVKAQTVPAPAVAQPVDQIAGVVGNYIILQSDIESQYNQFIQQGNYSSSELRCKLLDQLLLSKLLLNQANIDSLVVDDAQVMQKIDNNMNYFIQQLGSAEKLEKFYGKSIPELKEEFKPIVRDQLLEQQMQSKLTKGLTTSPKEVKSFFDEIPKDSLPLINAEVEYAEIVHNVPISYEEKQRARAQLQELRDRILKGEEFSTLAILYSQDKESAKQGGELGFVNRGDLVPSFEAAAFHLKNKTEISEIVESEFGYHIIQLIERRGEKIDVRHILIKPESKPEDMVAAQQLMDSVAQLLRDDKIKFSAAAEKYSDETDTKLNGGNVMNNANGSTRFQTDQVDPTVLFQLDKMKVGEISNATAVTTKEGKQAFRVMVLKTRTEPHRLNMSDDYQKLQELTLTDKQQKTIETWRNKKKSITYIRVADEYKSCSLMKDWITP